MSSQQTIQTGITAPPIIGGYRECEACGESFPVRRVKSGNRLIDSAARFCGTNCQGKAGWAKRGRLTVEERFWRFVDKTPGQGPWGDCWGWTGSTKSGGYGQIGTGNGNQIQIASILSYEIHIGPVPPGLQVCHECDNPPCTNPYHLISGTGAENLGGGCERKRWAELIQLSSIESELIVPAPVFDHLHLDRALDVLSQRQRQIIELRFGLNESEMTLEEVGAEFGFTRERARQIEAGALARLRRFYNGDLMKASKSL